LADHNLEEGSDEANQLEYSGQKILRGPPFLLNYAFKFGYSHEAWKTVAMMEKNPGVQKIHRLGRIHMYETDYNLMLAVNWGALLHHACDNNLVNESQYGSQPGKEALDEVFLRELVYEMCRTL
jgi:hypothetical protein